MRALFNRVNKPIHFKVSEEPIKEEKESMSYKIEVDGSKGVVWCPKELFEWYSSFDGDTSKMVAYLANTGVDYTDLKDAKGEIIEPAVWCGGLSRPKARQTLIEALYAGHKFKTFDEDECVKYMWVKQPMYIEPFDTDRVRYNTLNYVRSAGFMGVTEYYGLSSKPKDQGDNISRSFSRTYGFTANEAKEILGNSMFMYEKQPLPEGVR